MKADQEICRRVLTYGEIRRRWKAAPKLAAALQEAVATYGKPGGPWNVPSDPGGWIARAEAALKEAGL